MAKLIFLSGSVRKDSLNKKLVAQAYEFAKELGTDAKLIDLDNYEMPFFDNSFDKVFCFGVLQHTPSFATAVRALISKAKPAFAGIDPYNKYVDRNSDDNLVDVS